MAEPHHCPRCGRMTQGPQSLSRADGETQICPVCGLHEAVLANQGEALPPPSAWPVRVRADALVDCPTCGAGPFDLQAGLPEHISRWHNPDVRIQLVDDEVCPRCGAGWPNRPKVADEDGTWWWKCFNTACNVYFYDPVTGAVEEG